MIFKNANRDLFAILLSNYDVKLPLRGTIALSTKGKVLRRGSVYK